MPDRRILLISFVDLANWFEQGISRYYNASIYVEITTI